MAWFKRSLRAGVVLAALIPLTVSSSASSAVTKKEAEQYRDLVMASGTALSTVFPPALALVGAAETAFGVMDFLGLFEDDDKDRIGDLEAAVAKLQQQLAELEARVSRIEQRQFSNEVLQVLDLNEGREKDLGAYNRASRESLIAIKYAIAARDQTAIQKELDIAFVRAEAFLDNSVAKNIWDWTDTPTFEGGIPSPRFRTSPTLEYYIFQLEVLILAMEALDDPIAAKAKKYRARLAPHIAMLTGLDRQGRPVPAVSRGPLLTRIREGVSCRWIVDSRQASTGQCSARPECTDRLSGVRSMGDPTEWVVPFQNRDSVCPQPPDHWTLREEQIEDIHGAEAISKIAAALTRLSNEGGLVRDNSSPLGTAGVIRHTAIYAIDSSGRLHAWEHAITTGASTEREQILIDGANPGPGQVNTGQRGTTNPRAQGADPGSIVIRGAPPAPAGPASTNRVFHRLNGPDSVSPGWGDCQGLFPMAAQGARDSMNLIYCASAQGPLLWRTHPGLWTGKGGVSAPSTVGSGWSTGANGWPRFFSNGDGVFYRLRADGVLDWYRHRAHTSGTFDWQGPIQVGNGWGVFIRVFGGARGVIYAVRPDGVLVWYRHTGYPNGAVSWMGPREIGTGWGGFRHLASAGDGNIYAVNAAGDLLWYRHKGWLIGDPQWEGPVKLGTGFADYRLVTVQQDSEQVAVAGPS